MLIYSDDIFMVLIDDKLIDGTGIIIVTIVLQFPATKESGGQAGIAQRISGQVAKLKMSALDWRDVASPHPLPSNSDLLEKLE